MTGRQKAAVLLLSLGDECASDVLQHLDDDAVEQVSIEMAALRRVPAEVTESVLDDLITRIASGFEPVTGGADRARELLAARVGSQRAKELIDGVAPPDGRPFGFLVDTPPEQAAAFLQDEGPQTVALVLANLSPAMGARILDALPQRVQGDVSLRIARMSETSPAVVRELEAAVRDKLSVILEQELTSSGGIQSLAELLNQASRSTERHVVEALAATDKVLADDVRERIFTFDDIVTLSDRDIQVLLRDVDQKDLAVALRGVDAKIQGKLLSNMSSRGAEMLKEDMEAMPPQRKAVVDEAQSKIVRAARILDDAGTITIRQSEAEEEVV